MLQEILENEYLSATVILVSQLIFIFLRTLNVIYTTERKLIPAIITSNGIGLVWLTSLAIGSNSFTQGQLLPIIAFLIGGTLGTYWGIKKDIQNNKSK